MTKINYLYNVTRGFTDFSKIANRAKTSAISQLERAMERQNDRKRTGSSSSYEEDTKDVKNDVKRILDSFGMR